MGEQGKGGIGMTSIKGLWTHMKTYYYRRFLKHTHKWKKFNWSDHVMEEKMPQFYILCHQLKPRSFWKSQTVLAVHSSKRCLREDLHLVLNVLHYTFALTMKWWFFFWSLSGKNDSTTKIIYCVIMKTEFRSQHPHYEVDTHFVPVTWAPWGGFLGSRMSKKTEALFSKRDDLKGKGRQRWRGHQCTFWPQHSCTGTNICMHVYIHIHSQLNKPLKFVPRYIPKLSCIIKFSNCQIYDNC